MEGAIDSSDVLLNRGLNGAYGYGQRGNFGYDGSVVNANVEANRDIGLLESINANASRSQLSEQITTGNAFISEQLRERTVSDRFNSIERLLFSNQNDTQRDIANLNTKVAECCCKLEAGQAAIQAKLDAQALQAAQTENINLRISMSQGQAQGN